MKDIKNFVRKVNTDFSRIGRRFYKGDILVMQDGYLLHFYINENKDGIDMLDNPNAIQFNEIEVYLDNSEDI